jgi:hypothetical protein
MYGALATNSLMKRNNSAIKIKNITLISHFSADTHLTFSYYFASEFLFVL